MENGIKELSDVEIQQVNGGMTLSILASLFAYAAIGGAVAGFYADLPVGAALL